MLDKKTSKFNDALHLKANSNEPITYGEQNS
jgi:hypothetical protein